MGAKDKGARWIRRSWGEGGRSARPQAGVVERAGG